jgi:MraZ protein
LACNKPVSEKVINNSGKKWVIVEQSGNKCIIFTFQMEKPVQITFTGDFTCKLDDKGRVLLPAAFIKQMASCMQEKFVLKKDIFDSCLVLFPITEWEQQNQILRQNTSPFNREHKQFLRGFLKGTAEVVLDANNRLLLPKRLLDEIGADREIVLAGNLGVIEIWAKADYDSIEGGGEKIAFLAEKIMGNLNHDAGIPNNNKGE